MKTAIVIGSGLGGLECAFILAKHGMKVIVLERDRQIGGCLRTFMRKDSAGRPHTFDTGLHYVGGLGEGQSLYPLFKYFGLLDLPWKQLDAECFDEVCLVGGANEPAYMQRFPLASGHDLFVDRLAEYFPYQKAALRKYAAFLKGVGDNIFRAFASPNDMNGLFACPAYDFLNGNISDPLLRKVLSGSSLKLELDAEKLPLYVFAQINNSFIQSAWRLGGNGGAMISKSLADSITAMGGTILTNAAVVKIRTDGESEADAVEVIIDGEKTVMPADLVVSDAHPSDTVDLIDDCKAVRKIYRSRFRDLENTYGMFTANIALKTAGYLNKNIFVHRGDADLWHPVPSSTESVMVHFSAADGNVVDLLSPMGLDERHGCGGVHPYYGSKAYEDVKGLKLKECIDLASKALPGLEENIDSVWTSTPLTWEHYTGTPSGSAYGVAKDCRNSMSTVLSPRTPLRNLFMTGQSLNLHGMLGVSMTSVLTCGSVFGIGPLADEILKEQ